MRRLELPLPSRSQPPPGERRRQRSIRYCHGRHPRLPIPAAKRRMNQMTLDPALRGPPVDVTAGGGATSATEGGAGHEDCLLPRERERAIHPSIHGVSSSSSSVRLLLALLLHQLTSLIDSTSLTSHVATTASCVEEADKPKEPKKRGRRKVKTAEQLSDDEGEDQIKDVMPSNEMELHSSANGLETKYSFIHSGRPANRMVDRETHSRMKDMFWSPDEFVRAPGGSSSNVALALAALGGRVVFMGKLGDDEYGQRYGAMY
ncbi:hypothetical protein ZWY2020_021814 [Hordeum vulgare]|nr:hypothetical protein ZWY2020_021814 [Hordeum vulgare]